MYGIGIVTIVGDLKKHVLFTVMRIIVDQFQQKQHKYCSKL
jgi:hypothetical protein